MKRKLLAMFLTTAFLATSFVGCAPKEPTAPSTQTATATAAPAAAATDAPKTDTTAPATGKDTSPITLTVFMNHLKGPEDWKWGDDAVSQEITKKTGVTLDLSFASTEDNTELSTMLASGSKLPDFLVASTDGALRNMIVGQGFAQPLNKLADELCPEFWDVLPTDENIVYQEDDGNFYLVTDFFDDTTKTDYKLNPNVNGSFMVDQVIYNEMGRPDISTVDKFIAHLKEVKTKYPQILTPMWEFTPPNGLLGEFNRMYGATTAKFTVANDTLNMNVKLPVYKESLKLYNRFYKEGLINPETFTFKDEQKKAQAQNRQLYSYFGKLWTMEFYNGDPTVPTYEGILTPVPEGKKLSDITLPSSTGAIGGWHATFITKDCTNTQRAMDYLTFMLGDEGQILQRHGVEGVTWDKDEFGFPKDNATKKAAEAAADSSLEKKYGVYNYNFAWTTGNVIVSLAAHNTYAAYPSVEADFKLNGPYIRNERIFSLTNTLNDEDDRVLSKQIDEIILKGASQIVLSNTDAEFESGYAKLMSDLTTAGVDKLEKKYQDNYASWKSKGIK